ncbi:MAG TPA: DNA repair protein RecN [Ignavibacteria bacterium]|nr:DNA repair protein RecN [Ignavibacteria bacterium]
MIEKLFIRNYLIIKEAEIDFSKGLNILTGETGAGKSIILDAISMLLGERADYSLIKKDEDKLVVEGNFSFKNNKKLKNFLKNIQDEEGNENFPENGNTEFNEHIILRRELFRKGVSRNFINDSPVNISDMKKFGDLIIDIHSQNEHQSLLDKETHIEILDNFINNKALFSRYSAEFENLKKLINSFKELYSKKEELASKRSFLDFQLKEINNVNLSPDEDRELENEIKKLENTETISLALNSSLKVLSEDESNARSFISIALKELKKVAEFDKSFEKIIEDLENSYILVKESSESLLSYDADLSFDNTGIDQLRDRMSSISHLKKKFGLTVNELISKSEKLTEELNFADNFDYEIEQLRKKINSEKEETGKSAKSISELRLKKSKELENKINKLLKEIGLESAEFKVEIKNIPARLTEQAEEEDFYSVKNGKELLKIVHSGFDNVEFLIKTNKGSDFTPLKKSASGGEISRIMLAIKTVLSEKDDIPILVFDEIDAGISGRIAQKVGKMLHSLSESHQIICITHLPQIAAMSDKHFHVSKKDEKGVTSAFIKNLTEEEKITEVAKLISGEKVTEAATKSAIELIGK